MFINPNQLLGQKKNLRKVSTKDKPGEKNNSAHEPKEYGDCSQTVFEVKRKLEGKADGRPGRSSSISKREEFQKKGMGNKKKLRQGNNVIYVCIARSSGKEKGLV